MSDERLLEALLGAEERMEKAVEHARDELGAIRTGRASPAMFSRLTADYFGTPTPLNQLASITVPEARMAIIKPYDGSTLAAIEKAIRDSDLGVNPSNDGTLIRIVIPQLTEERRRELIKVARSRGEDAKVAIRNIRRHAKDTLDRLVRDGEAGEDEVRRSERELDETTARHVHHVDELMKHKEAELLEV